MSEEKSLSEMYQESGGNLTDEILETAWARFAPERSDPQGGEEPDPVPIRPLAEVIKEAGGNPPRDTLIDQIAQRVMSEDGLFLVNPVASAAVEKAETESAEEKAMEWYEATRVADEDRFDDLKAKMVQYVEEMVPEPEREAALEEANRSGVAFKELFNKAHKRELDQMIEAGKRDYPDAYKNFQSDEEKGREAEQLAAKEAAEKIERAKERLKKEMQSRDPVIRNRAQVRYFEKFVASR
jgi:hypothetical protein